MATETVDKFDVIVNVCGGGYTGQAGAIRHGIARKRERNTVSKQLVVLHSSANVNLLLLFRTRFIYSSERDCSEEFLYTRATDQSLCWHKPLQAVGKLLERFWQDCGKTMADCQDNLSDSE